MAVSTNHLADIQYIYSFYWFFRIFNTIGITIYLFLFAMLIKLESELANAQQSVQKLSEEVAREKETAYNSTSRVSYFMVMKW